MYCCCVWNSSRKLFIMQETFHTNLADEFVEAFEDDGLGEVHSY